MKATSLDNSQACYGDTSVPVLHVTLLGGEWGSSAGGVSTINRELAIHLSNHSAVKISLLVPEGACNTEEIREADGYGITIVEAKERTAYDRLDWLSIPPQDHFMDIVVGHGVKLGRQVQFIRDSVQFSNCKWVQVVHTAPEDLSRYKCYRDPISKGETKHESEVGLCKLADLVVPVGPRLKEAYCSYLQRRKTDQDVLSITPGLFQREFGDLVAKQEPNEDGEFKVLLFGRGDDEDFELKGYNIAAQAFTDQRLNNKCYHLIFVGAPEGKQEEVREKLLQCGIVEAQLTVRKFMQGRERLKDLLCEADIAIMPSKSEGFGLVALEALSAGLPILVGSRSGFAKALENVLHGDACIVNSDDPAEWAKAIEAVRLKHGMRLQEIKSLRASYGEMYSWKEQCEALVNRMRRMGHDASDIPKDVSVTEKQPVAKTHASASGFSGEQCPVDEQPKTKDLVRLSEESPSTCHTPSISGLTSDQEAENTIKMSITPRGLSSELEDVVDRMFRQQLEVYLKYNKRNKLSTASGLSDFLKHVEDTYNFTLTSVGMGSLVIKGQCPDLQSLESLWNDYCSGVLNEAAERFLVTDDMKKEINLVTLRLKTTIEEESYLTCKKALMEKSAISRSVPPTTESDQEAASRLIDTSPDDSEVSIGTFKMKSQEDSKVKLDQLKKHGPLPFPEILLYWVLWISMCSYSMYNIFIASREHKDEIYEEDLKEGWAFLGRKKDVTDFEWEFWTRTVAAIIPAMLVHMIGGLFFSRFFPQFKAIYCLMFTLSFLLYATGWKAVVFMIAYCLIVYGFCAVFKSVIVLWTCCVALSLSLQINVTRIWQIDVLSTDPQIKNLILFASMMSVLRCISFGIDYCWRSRETHKDKPLKPYSLMDLLVYNFYFPVFANGPVITFDNFQKTFYQPYKSFTRDEIKSLLQDTVRTIWWYIFLEIYLHFFYSTAITLDPRIFSSLSNWAIAGIMYSQLNIFLVKYKVFYIGAGVFARIDGVSAPLPPRCVTTLYLFSDMWKYFDRGLHGWMTRYIYIPMGGSRKGVIRQLTGSFLSFAFIWQWHGGHLYALWWFIPNWLGVVVESAAGKVLAQPSVRRMEEKLSPAASRRIRAIFGIVSLTCLILSNLVFLCGSDPVWFYVKRIFVFGWPSSALLLLFSMYMIVQTNMELNRHISQW